jgi:hypothetical protein
MAGLTSILIALIAILAIGAVCIRGRTFLALSSHLIIVVIYSAGWLATVVPVRFLLVPLVLATIAVMRMSRPDSRGVLLLLSATLTASWLAVFSFTDWISWWTASATEQIVRYLLLFTGAYWLGYQYRQHPANCERFRAAYLGWSLAAACLGLLEFLRDRTLLERADFEASILREGHVRAVLLTEHPLVLAALLTAALPIAIRIKNRNWRIPGCLVLIAGVYATQSRGALIACVAYLALRLILVMKPQADVSTRSLVLPVLLLAGVGTGIALLAGSSVAAGQLSSEDPAQASIQYRGVLYSKVGDSLATHPFGWGPAGLPEGVYLINSPLGTVDLAVTIDSEPVLLVLEYGVLGLVAFVTIFALCVDRVIRVGDWMSDSSLLLLLCSTFLALHAWTGLGAMTFLLLGGALSLRHDLSLDVDETRLREEALG